MSELRTAYILVNPTTRDIAPGVLERSARLAWEKAVRKWPLGKATGGALARQGWRAKAIKIDGVLLLPEIEAEAVDAPAP